MQNSRQICRVASLGSHSGGVLKFRSRFLVSVLHLSPAVTKKCTFGQIIG